MQSTSKSFRQPKQKIIIPDRVAIRAATKYVEDENGCWISTYSSASHGYAQIGWQDGEYRQIVLAHRASWVYHHGDQIPEGMTVDHLCRNRKCINPSHLRLLSNFENARRTSGRDWELGKCINGHPNSELRLSGKRRVCRICKLEWGRRYRERNREKVRESQRRYNAKKSAHIKESQE